MNADARCYACGRATDRTLDERGKFTVELRPYGPGGSWVCHACANATPERREEWQAAFSTLIGASEAVSSIGVAAIGQEAGPVPFEPNETSTP